MLLTLRLGDNCIFFRREFLFVLLCYFLGSKSNIKWHLYKGKMMNVCSGRCCWSLLLLKLVNPYIIHISQWTILCLVTLGWQPTLYDTSYLRMYALVKISPPSPSSATIGKMLTYKLLKNCRNSATYEGFLARKLIKNTNDKIMYLI